MFKHRLLRTPDWFPFEVIMLTRRRYKCAGYHVVNAIGRWSVYPIDGTPQFEKMNAWSNLSGAVNEIVDEYRRLWRAVEVLEKENGKVQS